MSKVNESRTREEEIEGWALVYDAAEKGSPEGQFTLGIAYQEGKYGREKNSDEAMRWFKKAIESGNPLPAAIVLMQLKTACTLQPELCKDLGK